MSQTVIDNINIVLAEYFDNNPGVTKLPAKDLMPLFVLKGIFAKDEKAGLPIRNLFRKLDKEGSLNRIPYIVANRKKTNTTWYFSRLGTVDIRPNRQTLPRPVKSIQPPTLSHTKSGFLPIISKDSIVLILGSLPGDESIRKKEYYAKSTNQFWRLMGVVLGEMPEVYNQRVDWLLKNKVGIWDVLASADRKGSLDSNIAKGVANNFGSFYKQYPNLKHVFFNGGKAQKDYQQYIGEDDNHSFNLLPSSSSAHTISFIRKCEAWKVVKSAIKKNN